MLALPTIPARFGRVASPLLLVCWVLAGPALPASPAPAALHAGPGTSVPTTNVAGTYGQLPLSFEPNEGQTDPSIEFLAHAAGATLFLSSGTATLSGSANVVRVQLDSAQPHPRAAGEQRLTGVANYLLGTDPSQWHTDIPTYARVRYRDVYPGVDLIYYGSQGDVEYDFDVSPEADPGAIRLRFAGADQVHLDEAGALVVRLKDSQLLQPPPLIYQDGPNGRELVPGGYAIDHDGQVGFAVSAYDRGRALIIDPVLAYSTLLGGSGPDGANGIAVDAAGQAYVVGNTTSLDFPTTPGALQPRLPDSGAAFVSKLNAAGSGLVYSTYLGGSSGDSSASGIAVDAAGSAYVAGQTQASDFPTTPGAAQRTFRGSSCPAFSGGCFDGFVTKLNPTGTGLVYSTLLGGSNSNSVGGLAVDAAGSAFVSGTTESADFPTTSGAFQTHIDGSQDAFVTRLNPTGTALVYSTYLGGSDFEAARGLALDGADDAYIAGLTGSLDFPTTPGAFELKPGQSFITKLNPSGSALVYSTYLSGGDAFNVAVDAAGNAYVAGDAGSDLPTTPGAFQRTFGGISDAFVMKLNATGSGLVYSTYLGGSAGEDGFMEAGIAVDLAGDAYVTGITSSTDFPVTPGAIQTTFTSFGAGAFGADAFVTKLNSAGSGLVYSTYLSGSAGSNGVRITVDSANNAYVVGGAFSSDFPTTPGTFQRNLNGHSDAFVSKVSPGPPACAILSSLPGPPLQLRTLVHADQGVASLTVTAATNSDVTLPSFVTGTTDSVLVTATTQDPTRVASFLLHATDLAGNATDCTIGGGTPPPPF